MAVVGKGFAVLQSGKVHLSGFVAWLACGELSDNSGGDSADDENPESGWRLPSLAPSINASGWLHAAVGFIRAGFDTGRVFHSMAGNNCRALDIAMLQSCFE